MSEPSPKEGREEIWRHRGRRYATGLNVCISSLLALALVAMTNYVAYRHTNLHWDISSLQHYALSEKTENLLKSIDDPISIITLFEQDTSPFFDEISRLLSEYMYLAGDHEDMQLNVEHVDPTKDLVRTGELESAYGITEAKVVIVEIKGRYKVLSEKNLNEYVLQKKGNSPPREDNQLRLHQIKVGFRGELMISSAIQSLAQRTSPIVYFLTGHFERDILGGSYRTGYGRLNTELSRDNIDVRPLVLEREKRVPEDCDALIIAGADRKIGDPERDKIASYLNASGRLLVLIDPETTIGLESLIEEWGIILSQDIVVGAFVNNSGDVVVTKYGNHPITRALKGAVTTFPMPRSIEPSEAATENTAADQPRVSILAITDGYAEKNLKKEPFRYDAGVDRPGPISIAVAVERGLDPAQASLDVDLRPTRMVVVGDSLFVSNHTLAISPGVNLDFFLNAINWLLEREELMAIAPKAPIDLHLDMDQEEQKAAFMLIVAALPLLMAVLGVVVWLNRRN